MLTVEGFLKKNVFYVVLRYSESFKMVCKDTLRIKHLPKELTDAQKEDFIKHFGAYKVKVITSKAKAKSVVYAKFETEEVAKNVMLRLHQIAILNCRLCVEYAETDVLQGQSAPHRGDEKTEGPDKRFFKHFIKSVNAFNESVGFYQPPPPHLKYNYPKANRATINNIAHALATVPRFYTQVLHLMNKMNLPPPFAVLEPAPRAVQPGTPKPVEKRKKSSSESEIESDGEKPQEVIPERKLLKKTMALKRPKFQAVKPRTVTSTPTSKPSSEEVFEKVEMQQPPKKIEVNVQQQEQVEKRETVESVPSPVQTTPEPVIEPVVETEPPQNQPETQLQSPSPAEDDYPKISLEELRANQVTDLTVMPVFKNYNRGEPTNKLYIKNCAKSVVVHDLEYIYNRYREDLGDKPSEFNIRLMQEGRMKGQAFVTLDSVEQAQKAVSETNGFILKDKPLVVVFGKAGKKK